MLEVGFQLTLILILTLGLTLSLAPSLTRWAASMGQAARATLV
jgi:hypothetical protein